MIQVNYFLAVVGQENKTGKGGKSSMVPGPISFSHSQVSKLAAEALGFITACDDISLYQQRGRKVEAKPGWSSLASALFPQPQSHVFSRLSHMIMY